MTYTATNPVNFRNKTGSLSDKLGTEFKNIQTEFEAVDAELIKVRDSNLNPAHKITRSATLVVAASDSSEKSKAQADYVCDGTADNVEIQAALDALPATGGEIHFLDGTFQLAATVARAIDNVKWSGIGMGTYLKYNAESRIISAGTQKGWSFSNMRVDYGWIDIESSANWAITNVWRNSQYYPDDVIIHIDNWGSAHLGTQISRESNTNIDNHPLIAQLDDFEAAEGWTSSRGTLTYDTNIVYRGTKSMKIVTELGQTSNLEKSITGDFTDAAMSFMIRTPDYTKISYIKVWLQVGGVWDSINYGQGTDDQYGIQTVNDMWTKFVISHFRLYGNADLANVTGIRIGVRAVDGQECTLYIDDLRFWKNGILTPRGAVTFTMDDGDLSVPLLAKPKLDQYNYAGNFSVPIGRITSTLLPHLKNMQKNGWCIINHSVDHDQPRMTLEPRFQYLVSQKWMVENGFKSGAEFASCCFGVHDNVIRDIFDQHFKIVMSTMTGYNSLPGSAIMIKEQPLGNTSTIETLAPLIDTIKTNKIWLNFMGHIVVNANPTAGQVLKTVFDAVVDYCNSQGVEVLTFKQIAERIDQKEFKTVGTGTITNGTTSINIRHGFHKAPKSIQITPTSSLGNAASLWVSSKDTGTGNLFTVSTNVDPGQDVTFDWQATL